MGCGPPNGYNDGPSYSEPRDYALVVRSLCRVMRRVRAEAPALYDKLCRNRALDAWLARHERIDRERINRKKLALQQTRAQRAAVKSGLAKLTPEERRALGVRKDL